MAGTLTAAVAAALLLAGWSADAFGGAASPVGPPLYRIGLRVHLGDSGRPRGEFRDVFEEINGIWSTQAGICFEIHAVDHDEVLAGGLDLWFLPELGEHNGYYSGPHAIKVRDHPELGPARDPHPSRRPGPPPTNSDTPWGWSTARNPMRISCDPRPGDGSSATVRERPRAAPPPFWPSKAESPPLAGNHSCGGRLLPAEGQPA